MRFLSIERVGINVDDKLARLFGAQDDAVSLSDWTCSGDGALVVSVKRAADGEGSFNARVEMHFELRMAADRSLVVHSLEQFYDLSIKQGLRETWYRFARANAP